MERVQSFGNDVSLYRILERTEGDKEALWFEGRTLTWGEVKMRSNVVFQDERYM